MRIWSIMHERGRTSAERESSPLSIVGVNLSLDSRSSASPGARRISLMLVNVVAG